MARARILTCMTSAKQGTLSVQSGVSAGAADGGVLARLGAAMPRAVQARIEAAQRDLGMIVAGLRGRRRPPFELRAGRARQAEAQAQDWPTPGAAAVLSPRLLRVRAVIRETADAVSLELEDPSGAPLGFVPGQFFTLIVEIGGRALRRAYSASSDPRAPQTVRLTSKRVAGGVVSAYLNDQVREGMTLRVLGPSGSFTVEPRPGAQRRLVLLAGGAGITPMMAILQGVLAVEPETQVALVYGNRGEADVLFARALAELQARHPERLVVRHVLSAPPPGWTGTVGILDEATLHGELTALGLPAAGAEYFLCGPAGMMDAARRALQARGVDAARIREERFASPRPADVGIGTGTAAAPHPMSLRLPSGERRTLTVRADETLLEAGLGAGAAMPFSCAMGGCGACKVRLVEGAVSMQEPNCLSDEERAAGYVLACVSCPRSPVAVEIAP